MKLPLSRLFAYGFWALAGVLLLLSLFSAISTASLLRGGSTVTGTVVGLEIEDRSIPFTDAGSGLRYAPRIRYQSGDASREFVADSVRGAGAFQEGDQVPVLVNESGARLNTFWGLWARSVATAGLALFFGIAGLISLLGYEKKDY